MNLPKLQWVKLKINPFVIFGGYRFLHKKCSYSLRLNCKFGWTGFLHLTLR